MKVEYEKEDCGRCGGSGQYSYNSMHGSRCYGCGGSGKRLTKRGAAAKKFADAMLDVKIEHLAGRSAIYVDQLCGRRLRFTGAELSRDSSSYEMYAPLIKGVPCEYRLGRGIKVRLVPSEQDVATIMAYQDSLTKAGTVKKGL
jgi:hypothetical protein